MKIVISGTVGVGKSTISEQLLKKLNDFILVEEIEGEDNIFLENFYKDIDSWSFILQMNFLLKRFKDSFDKDRNVIFDRHFIDDYIFASLPMIKDGIKNNLWNSYKVTNDNMAKILQENAKVDYIFLLKADFDVIINRIQKRGRESEKIADISYWRSIYDHYYNNHEIESYMKNNSKHFYIIDANSDDINKIVSNILNALNV